MKVKKFEKIQIQISRNHQISEKMKRIENRYLPGVFPENVPLLFVMKLSLPLDEANFLKNFLSNGWNEFINFVN